MVMTSREWRNDASRNQIYEEAAAATVKIPR